MNPNPYLRPNLKATRAGLADPLPVLEDRLDRLEDLLQGRSDQGHALDAYDLLAGVGWLERTRPDLLDRAQAGELLERARQAVRQGAEGGARLALTVPDPGGWLAAAGALDEAWDEVGEPTLTSERAERLLADLDDAQLALRQAGVVGVGDPDLERQLTECRSWLGAHADSFLAAGVWVQAVAAGFRPDLAQQDAALAASADLYVRLLGELEAAERELDFSEVQPWPAEVGRHLVRRVLDKRSPLPGPRLRQSHSRERLEVALRRPGGRPVTPTWRPGVTFRWLAPEMDLEARLVLPGAEVADPAAVTLTLNVYDAAGEPARDLERQPVWLAGQQASFDSRGRASFNLQSLQESGSELELRVREERTVWFAVAETTEETLA